jgi:transposase InsO family protein
MAYEEEKNYLIPMIYNIRKDHPTLSLRAMYYKIKPTHFGRDAFELLCKQEGFSLARKLNSIRTTNSFGVLRFENLLENIQLKQINQAWSSDITYYELNNTFYYITFIIDCYSRLIVGHAVSQRLTTEQTTLPALKMALKRRKQDIPEDMIFHSDGGGQYYDKAFLKLTEAYKMSNSMCAYAYENGKSERINGVIKNNYLVHRNIKSFSALEKEVDRSVSLYNNEKPHKALQYKTPIEYEKLNLALQQQNKPIVTKSFDA